MDDDEMEAMSMALVHYGLGLGLGLSVWHAGTSRVAISLCVERGVMLFIYSLGEDSYEGAFRLGEHEVRADDSKRWV